MRRHKRLRHRLQRRECVGGTEGYAMRNGREYLQALHDDRTVYLSGERVRAVPDHPAFANPAQTVAHLYDLALDPANDMRYAPADADSSSSANRVFMIPRSGDDLRARRLA